MVNHRYMVVEVSGPPASGKTTFSKLLVNYLLKKRIKFLYLSITGFHYASFLYSLILFKIINFVYKLEEKCKKCNLYDNIPNNYLKRHMKIILVYELISLYIKFFSFI